MPSARRQEDLEPRYSMRQLVEIRRTMLRYARSFPPGAERNQRRQIARSLRRLFCDRAWLDRNTVEGAPRPPRGLRSVVI
jgi:hypothetical protein